MNYYDKEEGLVYKVRKMDVIGDDNAEMANKMVYKSMRNTTSRSRSEIQST